VTKGKVFPKNIIDKWPEVFGEVELKVIPLKYLHAVHITFKDKKVWEIDIKKSARANWDDFESHLKELLANYEEHIENIDFQLDTEQIKKDITKITNKFLKRKTLR
jgi:hypothetical protein